MPYLIVQEADGSSLKEAGHRTNKVETLGALFCRTTCQKWIARADVILWIDNKAPDKELRIGRRDMASGQPFGHHFVDHARAIFPLYCRPFARRGFSWSKEMNWKSVLPEKVVPPGWRSRWSYGVLIQIRLRLCPKLMFWLLTPVSLFH